ncbi:MAG: hypothetical protein BGO21_26310 [Dyadobacter sp. 50-39]|nr:MAG: hypothetical protein BGO21_26310 [Dyadobacter sp. 50-39]
MTLNELGSFFTTLVNNITSEDNKIDRIALLNYVLPGLNLARMIDSDEITFAYFTRNTENIEIDGYLINDTGERLQLFLSNLVLPGSGEVNISRKEYYESLFLKAKNFLTKALKNHLSDVQAGDPAAPLIKWLENPDFQDKVDVIEIFLISNTTSVEPRGTGSPKSFTFQKDEFVTNYTLNKLRKSKKLSIQYQLIDLNRIYNFEISAGGAEPIIINLNPPLTAIQAADDSGLFKSYLAVIPARLLVEFYHDYSSRLLERNVRSFLQFKGVNQKLRETLIKEPEKFIAYNNGVTITATASEIVHKDGVALIHSLTDFQIVNGGQTTASIYFTAKDGVDLSKVSVAAKINVAESSNPEDLDDLISKISQYSNSQNKVSSVDLNSRSAHLLKIKKLSESITDNSGSKWFFERIRGEFNTMLRVYPSQRTQIEKNYPKNKRLSKEQMAKYYVAWGITPHLVRKGGEKVFRDFMQFIQVDHNDKPIKPENLGRPFYEDLIAKAIVFKEFEQIYGSGPNAIGQIRSTVVPYSISALYKITSDRKVNYFDLGSIWTNQALPEDLKILARHLLESMHEWCKTYSKSDDVGEYAKKEDLWKEILKSTEFSAFENDADTKRIIAKYRLSDSAFKKRYAVDDSFDFSLINETCRIHSNGAPFYNALKIRFYDVLSANEKRKLEEIVQKIQVRENLTQANVEIENSIVKSAQEVDPDWFLIQQNESLNLINVIGKVAAVYNRNLTRVREAFEAESVKYQRRGANESQVNAWKQVGVKLAKKEEPRITDLVKISQLLLG